MAATAGRHRRPPTRAGRAPLEQLRPAAAVMQRVHQLDHHPPVAVFGPRNSHNASTKYSTSRAGNNRCRCSRVSVVATTRSTNSGGNALVNAPTDTRSGNQPSGESPADPSRATHRSSRQTIIEQRTQPACQRLDATPLGEGRRVAERSSPI